MRGFDRSFTNAGKKVHPLLSGAALLLYFFRSMNFRGVYFLRRPIVLGIMAFGLVAAYSVHEVFAISGGISGESRIGCGAPANLGCHGTQSVNTVISISTDSPQLLPGQTYVFRLSVANPSERGAGCDIAVDSGASLTTDGTGSGLHLLRDYHSGQFELTQSSPRVFTGDSGVWLFKYTAPSKPGVAHIYVAANAVNLDGVNDSQDHWNLAVDTIHIAAAAVDAGHSVMASVRLFPNPSRTGICTLSTQGLTGASDVSVRDATGRILYHRHYLLGTNSQLELSALPNGRYFLSIRTAQGQTFERSILLMR